ncbi:MAG: hypothetical protein ACKN9V_03395 [Pseudomonadota bacterium]
MAPKLLFVWVFIFLGLTSCMKRTTLGRLNNGNESNIVPDYSNPSIQTPECENGVTLNILPIGNQNYRVNETVDFLVNASGCKYGYRLSYESQSKPLSGQGAGLYSTTFPKTFSSPGLEVPVEARLIVLGANSLPVREFPLSLKVKVDPAIELSCPEASVIIPKNVNGDYNYAFNLRPNREAKVLRVEGSEPSFIVASPTFSTNFSKPIQGNIVVKARNGNLRFTVQDRNNNQANCLVVVRKSIFGITRDFNRDRILDEANLNLVSDGYQLQISYTQFVGARKINQIIPATGFLPSQFYEWMIARDLNNDGRPDLIFFRQEGTPAVGKFKQALSQGGTVGGTDLSYEFSDLQGQWPSDRFLSNPYLVTGNGFARIVGMLNGNLYASSIENGVVGTPEPINFSLSLSATPNPVPVNGMTDVSVSVQGYSGCSLAKCLANEIGQCISGAEEIFVSEIGSNPYANNPLGSSYLVGPITARTAVLANCRETSYEVRPRVVINVTNPLPPAPPAPPACSLAMTRQGASGVCHITVSSTGGPVNLNPPELTGISAAGSWNSAGTSWTGTGPCSITSATAVSARVSGPGSANPVACAPASITVPGLNLCQIRNWVVGANNPSAQAGVEHSFNLGSLNLPHDFRDLDLRVTKISVDDHSPKLFVGSYPTPAGDWPERAQWSHDINTGLPHAIQNWFRAGENTLRCTAWNRVHRTADPAGCTFTFEGYYRTQGSCLAPASLADVTTYDPSSVALAQQSEWEVNRVLRAGEFLTAASNTYRLIMQGDGNLVLYGPAGALWHSKTHGNPGAYAVFQGDGNLVVYRADGQKALGHSKTHKNPGAKLILQEDGNLVIYTANSGGAIWDSKTYGGRVGKTGF